MHKQKGFTLVELLLVMALCAALTAVVYAAWENIQVKLNLQRTQSEVNIIVAAARAWHNAETSYKDISLPALCNENLLPHDMCSQSFVNPWGGKYLVNPTGNNVNFKVTITKARFQKALQLILLKESLHQNSVKITDRGDVIATFN
jgi:prepilin-type N-terminal cleavage/methylation domain-containing protein